MTQDPLFILAAIAVLAVIVVLAIGIGGFAKGGEFNAKHGNKMMRLRLIAQGVAVVVIMVVIWLRSGGN